jgi:hypothetical protein
LETITSIKEVQNVHNPFEKYGTQDGYKVTTNRHVYYVLIDNDQSCCESWGYLSSDDDLEQFVGSELEKVELTKIYIPVGNDGIPLVRTVNPASTSADSGK